MARRGILRDEVVEVVDHLGDLVDRLPPERLVAARRALRARTLGVRKGRWDAKTDGTRADGGAGLLIIDGALIHGVTAAHRTAGELLGPGDLLQPAHDLITDEIPFTNYWRAVCAVRLAILDARFVRTAALVPETMPALMAAVTRRTGVVSRQLVIVQGQAVENRILATLSELADRWGVMTRDGIVLPAFISQGTLALLLGARRPSVTSAMVRLTERGLVARDAHGRWLLPAELLTPAAA
jgi:CRP-like cAMP-binding protein